MEQTEEKALTSIEGKKDKSSPEKEKLSFEVVRCYQKVQKAERQAGEEGDISDTVWAELTQDENKHVIYSRTISKIYQDKCSWIVVIILIVSLDDSLWLWTTNRETS